MNNKKSWIAPKIIAEDISATEVPKASNITEDATFSS